MNFLGDKTYVVIKNITENLCFKVYLFPTFYSKLVEIGSCPLLFTPPPLKTDLTRNSDH